LSAPDVAYVALALVPGIGRARMDALLRTFPSATAVLAASQAELEQVPGLSRAAATAIRATRLDEATRLLTRTAELGGTLLTPEGEHFPPALREIPEAPTLLFAIGRLELARQPAIAIVGSRTHTRYGADVCRYLAGGAAQAGLAVVSGMARGIDALAHAAALDAGGASIGVLGNGLGVVYPSANRALYERMQRAGLLLTEFPPGERPNAGSFPRRNRLISGLAHVTLVVEAREKSGALITVDCALAQGREVLTVPGPITSPCSVGCNRLIQSGAKPVLGLRDVLEEFGLMPQDAAPRIADDLPPLARDILTRLDHAEHHVDELTLALERPVGDVLSALTDLELAGLVDAQPGMIYRRRLGG
jgi:DNA processing protein